MYFSLDRQTIDENSRFGGILNRVNKRKKDFSAKNLIKLLEDNLKY